MNEHDDEQLIARLLRSLQEPVKADPRFKAELRDGLLQQIRQHHSDPTSSQVARLAERAGCALQRVYRDRVPGPEFIKRHPLCTVCPLRPAGRRGLRRGLKGCLYTAPQPS